MPGPTPLWRLLIDDGEIALEYDADKDIGVLSLKRDKRKLTADLDAEQLRGLRSMITESLPKQTQAATTMWNAGQEAPAA
jgi:hypothetical protein